MMRGSVHYDTAGPEHRSLTAHKQRLGTLICPVPRLGSAAPVEELVGAVLDHLPASPQLV